MNNQRKVNWIQAKCGAGLSLRGTSVPLEGHAGNCVKRVEAESRIPARAYNSLKRYGRVPVHGIDETIGTRRS